MILALLLACPADTTSSDTDDSGGTSNLAEPVCDEPAEVPCVDEIISDFSLHDDKTSKGDVDNSESGGTFTSTVDASAGGSSASSKNAWTYARFTDDGLEKVEIDDETALDDMTWHIAARRYIVRLNSGASGPSCVGATEVSGSFDEVETPASEFSQEDFYNADCELKEDNSGLPGSPAVQLGAWWKYTSCVETTGQVFQVQLDSGRVLKFTVDAYYEGNGQAECNDSGTTSAESAIYTWRWAWLN